MARNLDDFGSARDMASCFESIRYQCGKAYLSIGRGDDCLRQSAPLENLEALVQAGVARKNKPLKLVHEPLGPDEERAAAFNVWKKPPPPGDRSRSAGPSRRGGSQGVEIYIYIYIYVYI